MGKPGENEIRICENHDDYQVPLIMTMAFIGAEYWCPYCGKSMGMLGAGKVVEQTEQLIDRGIKYNEKYKEYLHAVGTAVCSSLIWEGERISPKDLPEHEKNRLEEIRNNGWKQYTKIEKENGKD